MLEGKELERYKQELAPILRDKAVWDAFILLLEVEERALCQKLQTPATTDMLIRINAKVELINSLKLYRKYYAEG